MNSLAFYIANFAVLTLDFTGIALYGSLSDAIDALLCMANEDRVSRNEPLIWYEFFL
jgi:hypothetical protein